MTGLAVDTMHLQDQLLNTQILRTFRETMTGESNLIRVIGVAEKLVYGPWVESIHRAKTAFEVGVEPDPNDVLGVAYALESRLILDVISSFTWDCSLLSALEASDNELARSGCSLYFLDETTYRVAVRNTILPKGVWVTWREQLLEKALGMSPYGEA